MGRVGEKFVLVFDVDRLVSSDEVSSAGRAGTSMVIESRRAEGA